MQQNGAPQMSYLYGKLVTPIEKKFLETTIVGTTRFEKTKRLNAIMHTAQRNKTSLQVAHKIVANNLRFAEDLTKNSPNNTRYTLNKFGEICKIKTKYNGVEFLEKVSGKELLGNKTSEKNSEINSNKKFSKITKMLKTAALYVREMFKVY